MTLGRQLCQENLYGSESRETKVRLLVDGVLLGWFFQLNRDFQGWLIHHVVGSEGAVPACNHLYAHLAVGNAAGAGLAIVVGLQLQALLLLPAVLVHRMQNNFGVLDGLAVRVFEHGEIENRRRRFGFPVGLLLRERGESQKARQDGHRLESGHELHFTGTRRARCAESERFEIANNPGADESQAKEERNGKTAE